ncbi:hypothetical protein JXA84_05360 [candidate division WOR-3 bacterium]|nr:hypothetical protein [candidate division WOR-3 bacterium]
MKKILMLVILGATVFSYAWAKPSSTNEMTFDWAALFVVEGGIDDVEADDDWLLENDKDGGYVYETLASLVFSWDEVSGGDWNIQFRVNDANGDDIWSDVFYFDSSDDYKIQKWEFDVDYTGTYDVYVYINGYEWYHGTFESK